MATVPIQTGSSNSVTFGITLQRNSIDNPIYTRLGSQFTLSVSATPPFSLFNNTDYSKMAYSDPAKYTWNEYHKWKLKIRTYTPLAPLTVKRTPVVATRAEFGILGHYNKNKLTPFERLTLGGDGMTDTPLLLQRKILLCAVMTTTPFHSRVALIPYWECNSVIR